MFSEDDILKNPNAKSEYLSFIPIEDILDEETGEFRPIPGAARLPGMGDDGMFHTPNGIRYKMVNTKNNYTGIQYIQPDGKYAVYGEAVRLPNGEVYKGKNGKIFYQQNLDTLTWSDFSEDCVDIDNLDFDFQ
jgi:hypothetical protein